MSRIKTEDEGSSLSVYDLLEDTIGDPKEFKNQEWYYSGFSTQQLLKLFKYTEMIVIHGLVLIIDNMRNHG